MKIRNLLLFPIFTLTLFACTDKDDEAEIPRAPEPQLIVKFKFDPAQVRLDNLGQPSTVAAGISASSSLSVQAKSVKATIENNNMFLIFIIKRF